jgi:hypothetical protein
MKWPHHRNLRNRPPTPSKGRGPVQVRIRRASWQARIASCARTRIRATSAVTIILQDPILRRHRCDAEAYWRIWALSRLRTGWLDRAIIIDDSLSRITQQSPLTLSDGRRWPSAKLRRGRDALGLAAERDGCGTRLARFPAPRTPRDGVGRAGTREPPSLSAAPGPFDHRLHGARDDPSAGMQQQVLGSTTRKVPKQFHD